MSQVAIVFVPEDGTGKPDANSLVDLPYADQYFANRGNTAWAAFTADQRKSALIMGTAYASTQYVYKGQRATSTQSLPFPRVGVTDPQGNLPVGVPTCVKDVVCELAIRASKGPLIQDPTVDAGGRPVKMVQKRVGPLHKTIEYAGPGEYIEMSRYPAVDSLMCPWLIQADLKFANGVKVAGAKVEGISNSKIDAVAANPDRYTGPMNENYNDVVPTDGNSPF